MREHAREAGERVRDAAQQRAEHEYEKRGAAASRQLDETAGALQESAENFREHDQASLARLADEGAQMLSRLSDSIRGKSLEELSYELQHEARRHPTFFVAGAVGLGFAFSRFMRASTPSRDDEPDYPTRADEPSHAPGPVAAASHTRSGSAGNRTAPAYETARQPASRSVPSTTRQPGGIGTPKGP